MRSLTLFLVCVFCYGGLHAADPSVASRPNFVVLLCDDLGYGDLACFGHPHIQSPNLDSLAASGLKLTSCYAAAAVCSPSRAGLLTGRSPTRAGIFDWIPDVSQVKIAASENRRAVHLQRGELTLAKVLSAAGYQTAVAGKWHLNAAFNSPQQPQPGDMGFQYWFATQNNAAPSHQNPVNFVRNGEAVGPLSGFSSHLVADEAITWLENLKPEKPFFLYLPFHEPHEPVESPAELVSKYKAVATNDDEAQYFANVENVDAAIGKLLSALDRLKLADNTLIFFSSDNGPEGLNRYPGASRCYGRTGGLRGQKLATTEGGFRVPGIVRGPGKISAGQTSDEPVSSLDLMPTIANLASAELPVNLKLDGVDMSPVFVGKTVQRQQPLFWFYWAATNDERVAMRDGDWKVIAKLNGGRLEKLSNVTQATKSRVRQAELTDHALFNLAEAPDESIDLAKSNPAKLSEMSLKLRSLYSEVTESMLVWPAE